MGDLGPKSITLVPSPTRNIGAEMSEYSNVGFVVKGGSEGCM